MASKKDILRAMRFHVGQEVMFYPLNDMTTFEGKIVEILKQPSLINKDAGLFRIEYTYSGTSLITLEQVELMVGNLFPGNQLRFSYNYLNK